MPASQIIQPTHAAEPLPWNLSIEPTLLGCLIEAISGQSLIWIKATTEQAVYYPWLVMWVCRQLRGGMITRTVQISACAARAIRAL
jgi:hypothetical protein